MIIEGDCLDVMKTFADNHFSAIVTDPPYGLSFMGKGWDNEVPQVSVWKEALRISKPGAFLISMGGTRTFHRLTCAIEDAGWEIRDCISWLYGSGFPKSHNRFGIEGYGTALKPAWEPCIVAMKPPEGTFKQNAEKWGQAGINIDGSRIPIDSSVDDSSLGAQGEFKTNKAALHVYQGGFEGIPIRTSPKGRWPANVIFDEEAAKALDEQSGISIRKPDHRSDETYNSIYQGGFKRFPNYINDSGGASRFFYCAKASPTERNEGLGSLPLKEVSGCYGQFEGDGRGSQTEHKPSYNNHPTVKPLKLMEYLITLVMPPKDGLLLDPFAGSGTTIVATTNLCFNAIGIEKNHEYCEIARARIEHAKRMKQPELFTNEDFDDQASS